MMNKVKLAIIVFVLAFTLQSCKSKKCDCPKFQIGVFEKSIELGTNLKF